MQDEQLRSDFDDNAQMPAAGEAAPLFDEPSEPLARKGFFSIFDQGIVSGTNFLVVVILARGCTQAEVGLYALAWTIVVFLTAAQTNLISIPYTMYRHRTDGSTPAEYGGSVIVHQLFFSLVASACILGFAGLLSLGVGPSGMKSVAWALAVVVPFVLMRDFARRISFAHLALETAVVLDAVVSALILGCLVLLWMLGSLSLLAVYGVMGAACGTAVAGWFFLRKQSVAFSRAAVVRDWRRNWTFGRWAITGQATGLAFYALPWLLAAVCGEAETGKLAACTTLVGLSNLFVMAVANLLMPKAAEAYSRRGVGALGKVLGLASLAAIVVLGSMCLGVFLCGDWVAGIFFGPKYAGMGMLLTILAVAALADSLGQTAAAGIWAMDRPAANFVTDVVQVSVTFATAALLVSSWGALGIAVGIVAGRIAGTIMRWTILWGFMEFAGKQTSLNTCQAAQ